MPESLFRHLIYPLTAFIPRWSSLNRMGRSRLLKTSYVWLFAVPILAQLLVKMGPEIEIPLWRSSITITLQLPFSWKMLFYSSVAFSIASFIYSVRCPAFVGDYDKFSDFTNEGKASRQILDTFLDLTWSRMRTMDMASHLMILNEFINLFTTESVVADHPDLISTTTDRSFPKCNQVLAYGTIRDEKLAEAFWHVWNELNESCPATRTFCAFFYLLGSLFVLWVAFQNLLFVILLG